MARRSVWRGSGAIPPAPTGLGAPDAGTQRPPPPVAIPDAPVPRGDGRREGFVGKLPAGTEAEWQRWRVAAARDGHAGPHAASLLGHAALLAGALLLWGTATVVPATPPELALGLTFAEAPPQPPAADQPPPQPEQSAPAPPPPEPPPPVPEPPPPPTEIAPPVPAEPPPPLPEPVEATPKPPPRPVAKPRPAAVRPARPAPAPAAPSAVAPVAPAPSVPVAPAAAPSTLPPTLVGGMSGAGCVPKYPESAQRAGIQGRVVLRVQVAADGAPTEISVLTSSGSAKLDRAAADAMRNCRFRPASSAGRPTQGVAEVPYRFMLEN